MTKAKNIYSEIHCNLAIDGDFKYQPEKEKSQGAHKSSPGSDLRISITG
jgi:hypothetical protein